MANALANTPPPAPDIPSGPRQGGNALMGPQSSGPPQPQQAPPQMPAPNHQQTVAALRHFDAVSSAFEAVWKDPDLGKSDVRKMLIDEASKLVADQFVTPAEAVGMLATFPENPFQQKKWIMDQIQHNQTAANVVLGHHQQAFGGMLDQMAGTPSTMDTHASDMAGLMSHYRPTRH